MFYIKIIQEFWKSGYRMSNISNCPIFWHLILEWNLPILTTLSLSSLQTQPVSLPKNKPYPHSHRHFCGNGNISCIKPYCSLCLLNFFHKLSNGIGTHRLFIRRHVNKAEKSFRMWKNPHIDSLIKPTGAALESNHRWLNVSYWWIYQPLAEVPEAPQASWLDHIVSSVWDPAPGILILLSCRTTYCRL